MQKLERQRFTSKQNDTVRNNVVVRPVTKSIFIYHISMFIMKILSYVKFHIGRFLIPLDKQIRLT